MTLTEEQAFEAMRLFVERFWERGGREPVDVSLLLEWTSPSPEAGARTWDPAQWFDWQTAVRDTLSGPPTSTPE